MKEDEEFINPWDFATRNGWENSQTSQLQGHLPIPTGL